MTPRLALPVTTLLLGLMIPFGAAFGQDDDGITIGSTDENIGIKSVDEITNTEMQALKQIEEFTQIALATGEIPVSDILDRVGDRWIPKYNSVDDFEITDANTRFFINASLTNNDWNRNNGENYLRIYNFDTITGAVGDGHEVTLLMSELQKLQNRYNVSEPVKKFHDWLATKYIVPETSQEITVRLIEILGDEKFLKLAEKTTQSFNDLAENGSVPSELFLNDRSYWVLVTNFRLCESTPSCDSTFLEKILIGTDVTNHENVVDVTDIWQYALPEAHAQTQIFYSLFGSAKASPCDYDQCYISAYKSSIKGPGTLTLISYDPPGREAIHAVRGGTIEYVGSACSSFEFGLHNLKVVPYLGQQLRPERAFTGSSDSLEGCLIKSQTKHADAGWIYGFQITSTGSYIR